MLLLKDVSAGLLKYNESQERDDHGRFGSGGGELTAMSAPLGGMEEPAIHDYQNTETYERLNGSLRASSVEGRMGARLEEMKSSLDSAVAKSTLTEDTTLYRGISLKEYEIAEMGLNRVGTTFTDKGFSSTSTSRESARMFGRTIVIISAPKGTNALNLGKGTSMVGQEHELLLPRGSSFTVTGFSSGRDGNEVHVSLGGAR